MKNNLKINFLIYSTFLSICTLLMLMPELTESYDGEKVFFYSLLAFVNTYMFFNVVKTVYSTWIRYDFLFILGYFIVHFQIPFLSSIGIEPSQPDYVWLNKMVVNYATWLSTLALNFWFLGFSLKMKMKMKQTENNITNISYNLSNNNYFVYTRKLDLFLLILFILFVLLVGKEFLSGAYDGGDNWGAGAGYVFILLQSTIHLRIIYFFINNKNNNVKLIELGYQLLRSPIFCSVFIVYLVIFLFTGDRGPVMTALIILLGSYSIYNHRISLRLLLVFVLIGSTAFAFISFGRTREAYQQKSLIERAEENLKTSERSFNPTEELANSVRILYRALDNVPDSHPNLGGITYLFDVVSVIPFGASTFVSLTDIPLMYQSTPNFFTIMGQGMSFTYGEGSEVIADIYVNFGTIGVYILIFLAGYIVSGISYEANINRKHVYVVVFLVLLSTALYVNRANLLMPLRDIFYILLINKLFFVKYYKVKE